MKYAIIEELRLQYPVNALCNQMELSESGYYSRHSRPLSRRQQDIVKNEWVQVGVHRIKRLRRELGIRCRQKRKFKATTNSNHSLPVAPNRIDQDFRQQLLTRSG